jgi:hypothetical protein
MNAALQQIETVRLGNLRMLVPQDLDPNVRVVRVAQREVDLSRFHSRATRR